MCISMALEHFQAEVKMAQLRAGRMDPEPDLTGINGL
jgi:hypothetical protein